MLAPSPRRRPGQHRQRFDPEQPAARTAPDLVVAPGVEAVGVGEVRERVEIIVEAVVAAGILDLEAGVLAAGVGEIGERVAVVVEAVLAGRWARRIGRIEAGVELVAVEEAVLVAVERDARAGAGGDASIGQLLAGSGGETAQVVLPDQRLARA